MHELVREHLAGFWPDRAREEFSWTAGPISTRLPAFRVCRIAPGRPADPWIYATIGAWEASEPHHEFVLLAPDESPTHVETLAMVTYFQADPAYQDLDLGATLSIGRPWITDATADHLLVSLPYPFGPALEHCESTDGRHIRFLWLVPITAAEAAYRRQHGLEALEQLLETTPNVLDPTRPSLV